MIILKPITIKGFTLIETLLAVAIFSIVTLIATTIFSQTQRLQGKISAIQDNLSNARYFSEEISREIRLGRIDYDFYEQFGGLNNPVNILALIDENNLRLRYKLENQGIYTCSGTDCLGDEVWYKLSSDNIQVLRMDFYVMPTAPDNSLQQLITMVFEIKSSNPLVPQEETFHFQTATSIRSYSR